MHSTKRVPSKGYVSLARKRPLDPKRLMGKAKRLETHVVDFESKEQNNKIYFTKLITE